MLPHPAPPVYEQAQGRGCRHPPKDGPEAKERLPHFPSNLDENEGGARPFEGADHQAELEDCRGPGSAHGQQGQKGEGKRYRNEVADS